MVILQEKRLITDSPSEYATQLFLLQSVYILCISHENSGKQNLNVIKPRNKPAYTVVGDGNLDSCSCRHDGIRDNVRAHTEWCSFEVHVCNVWTRAIQSQKHAGFNNELHLCRAGPPPLYQKHPPTMMLHVMVYLRDRANDLQ